MRCVEVCRGPFSECWLTATAEDGGPAEAYGAIAAAMAERGIMALQEKVYGPLGARDDVMAARRARLGAGAEVPCTYIDGRPGSTRDFGGVQIWGLRGSGIEVATVARGRELRGPGFRMVCLSALRGKGGPPIEGMFAAADAALAALGLGFADVARTWIYLGHLLEGYADLNRVRTALYASHGIGPGQRPFPASTGIQGTCDGAACVMDVLAAAGPEAGFEPILETARQGPAFAYGSSFSRGAVLRFGPSRTILASGTAAIDASGRSRHEGDREAQIADALLALGALLSQAGASLSAIASATVFVKDEATGEAVTRVTRLLGIPAFPFVPMLADVCRPELLFEIEAVAPCGAPW